MPMLQGAAAAFNFDEGANIMLEAHKTPDRARPEPVGFGERRQPFLRGDVRNYLIAGADQVAFVAQVVRFGFSPADFALDIQRFPGKRGTHSVAATFAMTVENLRSGHSATYLGGPGHAWVSEFLFDLIAGTFGRP